MSPSYLQNVQIYYPSGKYKLSIRSFLGYCHTIVFVHNIMPLKRMFDAWYKYAQNFFIPEFDHNFCHAFTCHNTIFIYQQLNIIAPRNFFFQTHHHSYLKLDGSITDWFSKHS